MFTCIICGSRVLLTASFFQHLRHSPGTMGVNGPTKKTGVWKGAKPKEKDAQGAKSKGAKPKTVAKLAVPPPPPAAGTSSAASAASTDAEDSVTDDTPIMDATALKQMLGFLKYHGSQKKSPDDACQQALHRYMMGDPKEKRRILDSFKGPGGKSVKWAKEICVSQKTIDSSESTAFENFCTRTVAYTYKQFLV